MQRHPGGRLPLRRRAVSLTPRRRAVSLTPRRRAVSLCPLRPTPAARPSRPTHTHPRPPVKALVSASLSSLSLGLFTPSTRRRAAARLLSERVLRGGGRDVLVLDGGARELLRGGRRGLRVLHVPKRRCESVPKAFDWCACGRPSLSTPHQPIGSLWRPLVKASLVVTPLECIRLERSGTYVSLFSSAGQ